MVRPSHVDTGAPPIAKSPRPQLSRFRTSGRSGSFHAGEPFPLPQPTDEAIASSSRTRRRKAANERRPLRRQSSAKYHTFPTQPPPAPSDTRSCAGEGPPWSKRLFRTRTPDASDNEPGGFDGASRDTSRTDTTPLPWMQLGLLALLSLAEQTALNSIGPYLPSMVASFEDIPDGQEGLYVGLLASAFALAQLTTNLLWGYFSDCYGRKPTMLLGTLFLMICFLFFGFCTTYPQLLIVHIAMGLLNGNAAIVPTCLGELTDRTNQSAAFTWLPVVYSLGSITGPALGGLLVGVIARQDYPFIAPNILSAALLLASVVVLAIWYEETLRLSDRAATRPRIVWVEKAGAWLRTSCASFWQAKGKNLDLRGQGVPHVNPSGDNNSDVSDLSGDETQRFMETAGGTDGDDKNAYGSKRVSVFHELRNRNTVAVLGTYLVFQVANISYNSLYPIFAAAPEPTGRGLGPGIIGVSLSIAGLATILFQLFVFQTLKACMGNLGTYRYSLFGMAISMAIMPWMGYTHGKPPLGFGTARIWLYVELGLTLTLKSICAVGGLSSVMLLITNSASSSETLGTLNGLAQSLSAAGRSVGPFLSGSLFTLSMRVRPKGEVLAWGLFAGVALMGWLGSYAIRNSGLESADWGEDEDTDGSDADDEEPQVGT
ncbi:hypothetical protein VTJ83DRAFT_1454 [Remersonia thermophila]|uniref:Major facilitator superfamily (MFS) profile domain-containing protein n=1 Tax=Remersonia thermophila TaxID=72144 RepID=A0ABR4DFZ5_9PEZI